MIRDELNEQNTNVLTTTELNSIINDGYKDVAVKTMGYALNKTITTVDGQNIFAIPTTTARAFKVNFLDHNNYGVQRTSPTTVGFAAATVSSGKGTPGYYFQWGDKITVDPLVDSTAAGNTTTAFCSCYPAAVMSSDSDTPSSLPPEFHDCIVDFAVAFACLKLRRWGDAGIAYNRYIGNVQQRRFEYFQAVADRRSAREVPDTVKVEYKNNG